MAKAKKESKKFLIVLLIVLLLALAVGYAAFSDVLNIAGTATINASTFDLRFVKDTDTPSNGCYVKNYKGCTASVDVTADTNSDADDLLTVTVTGLSYPGAGADIQAVIKNFGTLPAKIKSVTPTNISGNSHAIVITGLDAITTSHPTVYPNGTCTFDFSVMWKEDVTELVTSNAGENNDTFSFSLAIEYEQDVETLNVTPAHNDANAV